MTDNGEITLNLTITDPELSIALAEHPQGDARNEFAVNAMKIGVLALRQAQGQIDIERVRREGDRLIGEMGTALTEHQRVVTEQIGASLKDYFDPESGRFNERVKRLIAEDGELERVIRGQVKGDDSALVQTLAAHVGQDSPLMRQLNPEASDGLIGVLTTSTEKTLSEQRDAILKEFSLDNGDGALSRMVGELKKNNGDLMGEFSLDREDSALSRLMGRVEGAQQKITSEFSLDNEDSALARMRKELIEVFNQQSKENTDFQAEVREQLAAMTARREEAAKSTRHGIDFEQAVFDFINDRSQKAGNIAEHTGNTTGRISRSRVGDVVITLGPEHAAAGAMIVAEAKEDASYRLPKALEELETARENRDAGVGLFVFSKSTAPADLPPFGRFGNDLVVVWDKEDPGHDVYLEAGISVAEALSVRARAHSNAVGADFDSIERAILEIQKQVEGLDEIDTSANTVRNGAERILNRARIMRQGLERQIAVLDEKVDDLRAVLGDGSAVSVAA